MSAENPADVIEQAAKVIMRHFNPSPDGSWRLNPSEAARALHDAGLLMDPGAWEAHNDALTWKARAEKWKADHARVLNRTERAEAEVARLRDEKRDPMDDEPTRRLAWEIYDQLKSEHGDSLRAAHTSEAIARAARAEAEVAELRADFAKLRAEHTFKCGELDRAYEERDELRATVERVADEWEREARQIAGPSSCRLFASRLRVALDGPGESDGK